MKKLMIAAAIVCAAALSQAASFTWSSDDVYMPFAITGIKEGTFDAATSGSTKAMSKWMDNDAVFTYTMLINGEESSGAIEVDGKAVSVGANNAGFVLPTDGSTKTIAWDIVINGTYDDGETVWTITSDHITGSKDYTKNSMPQIATAAPTQWTITAEDVPEPTSGLLLLLGVAGLALRRRRA